MRRRAVRIAAHIRRKESAGARTACPNRPCSRVAEPQRFRYHPLKPMSAFHCPGCRPSFTRRAFLADMGMGFTGLALGAMLARDGVVRAAEPWSLPDGRPHFPPKAKSVIWLFMRGGVSHLESFDPKPEVDKFAGKTIAETPYAGVKNSPFLKANQRVVVVNDANGQQRNTLYPTQIGFKKFGQSGADVS